MTFKRWSCQIDYTFMALIRLKSDWPRVRALSIPVIYQPGSRFYASVNTTAPSVPLTHVPGLQTISSTMPSTLQFTQSRVIVHWQRVFMQHRQPSLRALFMPDLCNDLRRTVQCMHAQESCSYEELVLFSLWATLVQDACTRAKCCGSPEMRASPLLQNAYRHKSRAIKRKPWTTQLDPHVHTRTWSEPPQDRPLHFLTCC